MSCESPYCSEGDLRVGSKPNRSRVLENSYSMSRATNLECADNGGAVDFLAFSWSANPKRRRATLAAALQISFSAALLGPCGLCLALCVSKSRGEFEFRGR